jgi:hypothetical protein
MSRNVNYFEQQSNVNLEEMAKARPPRGTGAPSRSRSHYTRILELLRARGPAGVLSSELYDAPHLYGRSPRNRVSEMRADGQLIQTVPVGASAVRYILTHENPCPIQRSPAKAAEWKHRPRVTGLPLFDLELHRDE